MVRGWTTENNHQPVLLMPAAIHPEVAPLHVLVADDDHPIFGIAD